MNEREFVNKKRADWDRLSELIKLASGRSGVRGLTREQVRELGPLYRRSSSDLAQARLHATTSDLVIHLNGLVGSAHALMFEAETSRTPMQSVVHFYAHEFPTLLQKHKWYFLTAIGITLIGAWYAYWLVIAHPDRIGLFIPENLRSSADAWKAGKVVDEARATQAGMLMTHNWTVGVVAFALGVLGGIPTAQALFSNGTMLGAMSALMTQVHRHNTFWPGIVPHGIAELTAIFICGGAGFLLGMSLLFPGKVTRLEAFKNAGVDAIKLLLGTVPLFIFAGIVEGMFSHLPLHPGWKYAFAVLNGTLWYLYLFLPRSPAMLSPEKQSAGN